MVSFFKNPARTSRLRRWLHQRLTNLPSGSESIVMIGRSELLPELLRRQIAQGIGWTLLVEENNGIIHFGNVE